MWKWKYVSCPQGEEIPGRQGWNSICTILSYGTAMQIENRHCSWVNVRPKSLKVNNSQNTTPAFCKAVLERFRSGSRGQVRWEVEFRGLDIRAFNSGHFSS